MRFNRPAAFVVLAFIVGITMSQVSFASADDSANPFMAIWDAIDSLNTKTDSLQAQIDDLKTQQNFVPTQSSSAMVSEPSVAIVVESDQQGESLVHFIVRNAGPESAAGVKLTAYYQTSLLRVNFIQGASCVDESRGIIECYVGTLQAGSEQNVAVDVTQLSSGQQSIIIADISSVNEDLNQMNNHAEWVLLTSSAQAQTTVDYPPTELQGNQIVEQQPSDQTESQEQTKEQDSDQPQDDDQADEQSENQEQSSSGEPSSSEGVSSGSGSESTGSDQAESSTNDGEDSSSESEGSSSSGSNSGGSDETAA